MLEIVKKIFKLPIAILHPLIKRFSESDFSEKEIETVEKITEKIINGNQLKQPYYDKYQIDLHQNPPK